MNDVEAQAGYETGGFRIDPVQRVLLGTDGARVPLPSRAFELLLFLVRHPGELLDKNQLMVAVWPNTVVEENNLTQAIGALRKALGEVPGENRFLVTDPGRGYRFVAPVRIVGASSVTSRSRWLRIAWILLVPVACAAIAAAVLLWPRAAPPPADRSIAVLPFENHSEARENAYLALGIQDEILTLLTRVADLRVVPRTSTLRYGQGESAGPRIGRELGVAYLLEGSVQRAGDTVRINVTLIDAAADRHLWAQSYERPDQARGQLRGLTPAPDDWRSLRAMSRQLMLDRKPADAVMLLTHSLEHADALGTRRGFVRRWLADAQRLAGDASAAQSTYARSLDELEIAKQPANPALMAELAIVRGRLGPREAGERLVPRCLELAENPRRESLIADCRQAHIQVLLAAGDARAAVSQLAEALSMRGAFPPLTPALLRLDPDFDGLRAREDFRALQ